MADPYIFIFPKFFGPFWGAPGALALYFRIPLVPLHVPIFFPAFQKKSHPEEIPRKSRKPKTWYGWPLTTFVLEKYGHLPWALMGTILPRSPRPIFR